MKHAPAFAISMSLNLALAAVAAHLLRRPAAETPLTSVITARSSTIELRVVTNLPPQTTFITNRFHWRQLESTNYDEFVANLRGVGCPERTIRDIIVGDVWQTFAASEHGAPRIPFWTNGPRRVAAQRQHEAEGLQLRNDLAAMLRRQFGYEWSPKLKRDLFDEEQAICRVVLGDLSEDQLEKASALILSAESVKEEVAWQCRDVFLDEDYAGLRRRRDDLEQRLRTVLSPAQFEEFSARAGLFETMFGKMDWLWWGDDAFKVLELTPAELRRMALAGAQVRPLGWKVLELDDSELADDKEQAEASLKQQWRAVLGEARFAELELLEDSNYRNLRSFTEGNNLPVDTAHKLYEVRKLAAEEVRKVRDDKSLDSQSRTQRLDAVTGSLTPAVSTLLGPKMFGEYLRSGGQWVTNLNRL